MRGWHRHGRKADVLGKQRHRKAAEARKGSRQVHGRKAEAWEEGRGMGGRQRQDMLSVLIYSKQMITRAIVSAHNDVMVLFQT